MLNKLITPFLKAYVLQQSKKSIPQNSGTLSLKGLTADVQVHRDNYGVPHIYAHNDNDTFFAQGFVHVQDRWWQMFLTSIVATGNVAKYLGHEALHVDRAIRTLGLNRLAQADIESLRTENEYDMLEAYIRGVNAGIQHLKNTNKIPVEFTLLKISPPDWKMTDTLAIARLTTLHMSYGWLIEIERQRIVDLVGTEHAAEIDIHYPHTNPVALPQGNQTYQWLTDGRLEAFIGPLLRPQGGSNNWSVNKTITTDGQTYLCNDPHLGLLSPSVWYENHLCSPDNEITGVSMPGLPMVLLGHNRHIAWGATLAFTDIQDTFVETFTNEQATHYIYDGKQLPSILVEETIEIKDKKPHTERIIYTQHGPVISDVADYPNKKITLRSMALLSNRMLLGFARLGRATSWDEFVMACSLIEAPSLNLAYADNKGNAGYYMTGKVPIRAGKNGQLPRNGSLREQDWVGFVPFDKMPHALNPTRGFNYSCNHKIVDDSFPYYLGNEWMNGYRAKRFEQLMDMHKTVGIQNFKAFQNDFLCLPGMEMQEVLRQWAHTPAVAQLSAQAQAMLSAFLKWDGMLDADTTGGTIYQVLKQHLIDLVIGTVLGKKLNDRFKGAPPVPIAYPLTEFYGHDTTAVLRIMQNAQSWWNKQAGGTDAIWLQVLEDTYKWLRHKLGNGVEKWQWGKLHVLTISHAFGQKQPTDEIFNIKVGAIGGDTDTLCQMGFTPHKPYDGAGMMVGPSWRQIINTTDFSKSLCILPPGQSGNLASPHYKDQLEMWLNGQYKTMLWTPEQVQAATVATLVLKPV
jgi:penicillin amidase